MRWIYMCGNRLLNMRVGKPETMHSPAASKGATEAPTCIPLCKGTIYIYVLDSREREGYSQDVGWRRRSAANKNKSKEYRRKDQYLSASRYNHMNSRQIMR